MDDWGFDHLSRWLTHRTRLPVGPLFCVIDGPDARPAVGADCRAGAPAPARARGRRAQTLCSPPAAPRTRDRDGTRRGRAQHHPTPARAHRPRRHLDLPPRDRQRRNHQRSPQPKTTNDARQRRAQALRPSPRTSGLSSSGAAPREASTGPLLVARDGAAGVGRAAPRLVVWPRLVLRSTMSCSSGCAHGTRARMTAR